MKKRYIVQLQSDLENQNEKIITRFEEIYDSENFQTSIVEIEDIEVKEDEYKKAIYDTKDKVVKFITVKQEKTDNEKLNEEITLLKKSIMDLTEMLMESE